MSDNWTVKNKIIGPIYHLNEDGSYTLRAKGAGWQLTCPKGHQLHAFADFASLPVSIGVHCEGCGQTYPVQL